MPKDFNKDLDHSDGKSRDAAGQEKGRREEKRPDEDPKVARERSGEGFHGAGDEYAEAGQRGAGYREEGGQRDESPAKPTRKPGS